MTNEEPTANPFGPTRNPFGSTPRPSSGDPPPGQFGFPADPTASSITTPGEAAVQPPLFWLVVGLVGVLIGVLTWLTGDWRLDLMGWLAALGLGLGGVFGFTAADLRLRSSIWYISRQGMVPAIRVIVTVGAVVAAGLDAWAFADWFARLDYFA